VFKRQFDDTSWRDGFSLDGVNWMIDQGTTYVANEAGKIVGTTALEWSDDGWGDLDNDNAGYIRRLAVADGQHGKGVAKFILDWALQEVANKDRDYLRLDCAQKNTSLCKYYENQGFELVKTAKFEDSDAENIEKSNLYQKRLRPGLQGGSLQTPHL
jgi:GNAT superfamily N-acetyltransferase